MTVMGDASMEGLSDAGSTPARSMEKTPLLRRFFVMFRYHGIGRLPFLRQVVVENVDEFSVGRLLFQLVTGNFNQKFAVAFVPAV